ncbi:hypothetical protein Lalb_Chr25g0287421 [Lupinus albus]|uniref:Reverse transcriptase zinc-binding domain-containing protein n=1 Tax=Lupinus albus TaxID=3870 RepID=A0A6A4N912_LUPAL|nr:hypothetical protein Lalb_Chr25g0287421 [Lupinus albus]
MIVHHVALPLAPTNHFLNHVGMVKDKRSRQTWSIIWYATIWALWRVRNNTIFNNVRRSISHILDVAMVNDWLWIKNFLGMTYIAYSDWILNHLQCMNITL